MDGHVNIDRDEKTLSVEESGSRSGKKRRRSQNQDVSASQPPTQSSRPEGEVGRTIFMRLRFVFSLFSWV